MTWLLAFFGAALLVALTPGANNLLGMHHGMRQGLARGLAGLGGRIAAFTILIAAVAAGLGPLLAASELALTIIKWAGVAYLLFLGVRILLSAKQHEVPDQPIATSFAAGARKEFLVAITNPKAILIFTAFVPQFIAPEHGAVPAQVAILGGVYLIAESLAGGVYIVAGAMAGRVSLSRKARRNLDRGTGVVLLGMAGALATAET